ncbi:unnamed protein product [Protopolystoma xenopodis]|uniref:Calcium-binding protein 39 n=1 Tax=Protopolystoma xenopodis TaxID=117903 RepID=A0A448WUJ5_9PLAT|nr:unnamed protein product [Protopolystoma xenopodis]
MLRDACRHEALAKLVLGSPEFYQLFNHVQGTAFDVSSDAFATLKDLLTRHKPYIAEFLAQNYDEFFCHYANMINSDNYVTKRQALKLLGELLLDRHNFSVMTRYIADAENLKVFVANPNKPPAVHMILYQNQEKLISFLSNFQTERTDDGQFNDEKQYLIKQIRDLKPLVSPGAAIGGNTNASRQQTASNSSTSSTTTS